MGKRTRRRQREAGLRKAPQEPKGAQLSRTLAMLRDMDKEIQRVVQGP